MERAIPAVTVQGILFDLDGVLVDSRRVVETVWQRWASERGIDVAPFLAVAHGRRTSATLRAVAPDLDVAAETAALDALEARETDGLKAIPGARDLVGSLPADRWGIVTSGSLSVATLRLRTAGLPIPQVFVTGEIVVRGKPDPEGFLLGAQRLGAQPQRCVVFEDAPPGVEAATRARMPVIGLTTTHAPADLGPTTDVVADLASMVVTPLDDELVLTW